MIYLFPFVIIIFKTSSILLYIFLLQVADLSDLDFNNLTLNVSIIIEYIDINVPSYLYKTYLLPDTL